MPKTSLRATKTRSPDHLENITPQFLGPFLTRILGTDADDNLCVVTSRRHRKKLQPLRVHDLEEFVNERLPLKVWLRFWEPTSISWWLAVLFMIGSALFTFGAALAIFPSFMSPWWHQPIVNNSVFFVGSIFFTTAGATQYLEVINSELTDLANARTPDARTRRGIRWFAWRPRNLGYLASLIQLIGTILFNFNTGDALISNLTAREENLLIWTPNMIGSLCFLISTWCSYLEVGHRYLCFKPKDFAFWIVAINGFGSIAFQISAVASYYVQDGTVIWTTGSNWGTFLGGLGFLLASYLLIPELFEKEGEIARMKRRTGLRSEQPALKNGGQTEEDQKTHGVGDHRQEDR